MSEAVAAPKPDRRIAFVFPGQGSQKVGMGRAWAAASPVARDTFAEADEALGFALSTLCFEGPEAELGLTTNTQPALLATSIAVYRALAPYAAANGVEPLAPLVMAGHSLGEYSALVAAGTLDFARALYLVRRRGECMQAAVPVGVGAMAAIIGLSVAEIASLAADAAAGTDEVCAVANLNGPGQTVIAGHQGAIDRAVELAKARGARKASLLPVSAPFHSPLMRPAREAMAGLLAETAFRDPRVPVITNVDAAPVTTGAAARDALVRQIDSPVRWVESAERMVEGFAVNTVLEVGPGNVLTGMTRRIVSGVQCAAVGEPDLLRKFLDAAAATESKD